MTGRLLSSDSIERTRQIAGPQSPSSNVRVDGDEDSTGASMTENTCHPREQQLHEHLDGSSAKAKEHIPLRDAPRAELPAAVGLLAAVARAPKHLHSIGSCPAKYHIMHSTMGGNRYHLDSGDSRRRPWIAYEDDLAESRATDDQLDDEEWNSDLIDKLSDVRTKEKLEEYATGQLEAFQLRIVRPGCEFDGRIAPINLRKRTYKEKNATEDTLKAWYNKADDSGFGDAREQVTRYDEKIRNAREIPASQFSVPPALIQQIRKCWDSRFPANAGVRVEPYKIHLYGPGGHFKTHRDTPQTDLVGTFLVGLGDTVSNNYGVAGGLRIKDNPIPSHEGRWCAFYPDVPHCVVPIDSGYRATIAFKLFRDPGAASQSKNGTDSESKSGTPFEKVRDILEQMRAPYGLLLERQYAYGTSTFSGFDSLLLECARSLSSVVVHHLPVIVSSLSEWGTSGDEEFSSSCRTFVYPCTREHVKALAMLSDGAYSKLYSHTQCGCSWLEGVKDVPFFSLDFSRAVITVKDHQEETVNYVGNEAQAWREDSVYFAYAMLVLPSPVEETSESSGEDTEMEDTEMEDTA
ncbi:hypothetical protein BD413DRAFT_192656 [Trametes elegans]|nr:hypothetical protein BD413DRAFT_192656 [Trametes elegans]